LSYTKYNINAGFPKEEVLEETRKPEFKLIEGHEKIFSKVVVLLKRNRKIASILVARNYFEKNCDYPVEFKSLHILYCKLYAEWAWALLLSTGLVKENIYEKKR